jgi:hypothetical protein
MKINTTMKNTDKPEKQERRPDETLKGEMAAHLVIKDKKSGKVIVNQRG